MSSPTLVRSGAVALVLGNLAGVSATGLQAWVFAREALSGYAQVGERVWFIADIVHGGGSLLVAFGLLGLYAALTKRFRWPRRLAGAGVLVAVPLGIGFGAAGLYQTLAPMTYYGPPDFLTALFFAGYFGQPVGVVLLGVAALWTRGLGRLRFVPLAVGLIGSPLLPWGLFRLFLHDGGLAPSPSDREIILGTLLFFVPTVLAGLGWIAVGLRLFGVREREAALLAKERRATEEGNLRRARRLYEEAWGTGNLCVADELAAAGFLDRRSGGGKKEFKRAIADLRRTFPDLRVSVEEQTARDDTVVTRCAFSGTDRGGLLYYPPTGKRAAFTGTFHDRFVDGELAEHRAESDTAGLLRQLGLRAQGG